MDKKPDSIFGGGSNEMLWFWLDNNDIQPGDMIRVETYTHQWKNPFTVTKDPDTTRDRDLCMVSEQGIEYRVVTFTKIHPLENPEPILRKWKGFESRGVIERLELYKK